MGQYHRATMSQKKRATLWGVLFLLVIFVMVVWHVVHWHSTGVYLQMFERAQAGRGYITALYNVGLMIVLGFTLGSLTDRIANLIKFYRQQTKHTDNDILQE